MNLLCPNCQKMLQVPEQYAGQQMKCPLCAGSFTVPALPPMPAAVSSPPPMSSPTPPGPGIAAAVASSPPREAARNDHSPDDGASNRLSASRSESSPPPAGYTHTRSYTLHRKAIQFAAPVLLVLVFVLTFFPWVGLYPGGDKVDSQNGWGAAFGSFEPDADWVKAYDDFRNPLMMPKFEASQTRPGVSGLTLIFLILFVLAMVPLAVLAVLLGMGQLKVPPGVQSLVPFRSALLGAVILVGFLLLLLQALAGFGLDSMVKDLAENNVAEARKTVKKELVDYRYAMIVATFSPQTTIWFRLVLWLLVLAAIGAGLDFWLERRGNKPLPRADLMW